MQKKDKILLFCDDILYNYPKPYPYYIKSYNILEFQIHYINYKV